MRLGHVWPATMAACAILSLTSIATQAVCAQAPPSRGAARGPATRGAAAPGNAAGMFQNAALTLSYPKTWTRLDPPPSPSIQLMVYPGETSNKPGNIAEHFALIVPIRKEQTTLAAMGDDLIAQDRTSYTKVGVAADGPSTIGGVASRRIIVDLEREGVKLRRVYHLVLQNGVPYTFMYGGDPEEFEKWQADVEKAIASTKWKAQATSRPAAGRAG